MYWEDFAAEFERLTGFYGRKANQNMKDHWWRKLKGFNNNAMIKAVDEWLDSQRLFPTPGELSALCFKHAPVRFDDSPDDGPPLSELEQEFNEVAWHLLAERAAGNISGSKYLLEFKYAAQRCKVDHTINWELMHDPGGEGPMAAVLAKLAGANERE